MECKTSKIDKYLADINEIKIGDCKKSLSSIADEIYYLCQYILGNMSKEKLLSELEGMCPYFIKEDEELCNGDDPDDICAKCWSKFLEI